ncbi:MAG: ATP-binding protein [Proteobacteria bacterium]|jgi:uncharacterized protein|nr:ATP-binding protein [Pseudomonadota bacterium]
MERASFTDLLAWKDRPRRRPLVIRGARQVGKSTLVRLFARESFDSFVELNFEQNEADDSLFASRRPAEILPLLEARTGTRIIPGRTLLFLDELQAAPEALRSLRFFFEELPNLHVIGAGSLLELTLAQTPLPMPVGRIEFLHLGPMTFEEFLMANGQNALVELLTAQPPDTPLPDAIHLLATKHLKRFIAIGGMPDVVRTWVESRSPDECDRVQRSILSTFEADFAKYGPRVDYRRLSKVFRTLPRLVGGRFKYAHVDRSERAKDLARALDLLCLAWVSTRVCHSAANGVPLGAEANERNFKVLFLDVGLMSGSLGLGLADLEVKKDIAAIFSGSVGEQFVGQHLLHSEAAYVEPRLHFWARQKRSSTAEVDYVLSEGVHIVPIEVKSGKTGRLKSLHLYMREKGRVLGLRLWAGQPSVLDTRTSLPTGEDVSFRLVSLPLYMVGQVRRVIRQLA